MMYGTREKNTKESNKTMSKDIIKELVDKEADLEECIKTIQKLSETGSPRKIISGDSSTSVSISLSQKFKTDADVFTGFWTIQPCIFDCEQAQDP